MNRSLTEGASSLVLSSLTRRLVPRVHSPGSVAGGWWLVLLALDVSCLVRSLVPGVVGLGGVTTGDRLVRGVAAGGLVLMVWDVGLFGRLVDIVMDWRLVVVLVRVRWAVHRGQEPE